VFFCFNVVLLGNTKQSNEGFKQFKGKVFEGEILKPPSEEGDALGILK